MILKVLIIFTTFYSPFSQAFNGLYQAAEESREIVSRLPEIAPLSNAPFSITREQADTVVALGKLDSEIDAFAYQSQQECEEDAIARRKLREAIADRSLKITFSISYSGDETEENLHSKLQRDTYANAVWSQSGGRTETDIPPMSYTALVNKFERESPVNLDVLTIKQRAEALQRYLSENYGMDIPKSFLIEEALQQEMIRNPEEWKSVAGSVANELNFNEKMRISARLGNTFLNRYNDQRAGTADGKAVTMIELLESAGSGEPGGVCRDIAAAQGQLLQAMGVPKDKIYIVGYATPDGQHAVLAVQDPDNSDRLVQLNYGEMTQTEGASGGAALKQQTSLPSTGIAMRIYDADAKPIGRVPTEIGALLKDVTNAPKSFIEIKPYTLAKVGFEHPLGKANVFTGTTSTGDKVIGAAVSHEKKTETSLVQYGFGVVQQEVNSATVVMNQDLIYGRVRQEIYTPNLTTGAVKTRAEIGIESEVMFSKNSGQYKDYDREIDGSSLDVTNSIFTGVTSTYEAPDGALITAKGRVYGFVDWADATAAGGRTLAFDRAEGSVEYRKPLSGGNIAIAETGLVARQYGEAIFIGGILENPGLGTRYTASYNAPLSSDVPSFMPESQRRFGVSASRNVGRMNMEFGYERNLDSQKNQFIFGSELKF